MNKRITKITLKAYRAFYEESTIHLPKGENVLIYGENGSGKSSLYAGLADFFGSAAETRQHLKADEREALIKIEFTDDDGSGQKTTQDLTFPQDPTQQPLFVAATNKLHAFLSYKELLKTYLIEPQQFEKQYFELLVNTILPDHQNPFTQKPLKTDFEILQASSKRVDKEKYLNAINDGLLKIFGEVNTHLQSLLDYFNHHLHAELIPPTLKLAVAQNLSGKAVGLQVNYFAYPRNDLSTLIDLNILNEARLSALAISIYLASILSNPTDFDYKILFLDDIFIGLDMSNRLPLLRILQDKFADYQIFLTTYDRHWFEVAKLHLKTNWQAIEMYVGQKEGVDFEFPIIIAPSDDYYAKAEKYFHKKPGGEATSIDYPAAANYLRKECERLLKEKLFGKYLLKNKGKTGESSLREELGELKDMFNKMMDDIASFKLTRQSFDELKNEKIPDNILARLRKLENQEFVGKSTFLNAVKIQIGKNGDKNLILKHAESDLDWTPFQDFDIVIKTTLNPFSHDNLEKPIYKTELAEAFRLIDALRALKRVVLLPENELIALEKTHTNGTLRKTVLKITNGGIRIVKQGNVWKIPQCALQPLRYIENGQPTDLSHLSECDVHKAYDMICHHMYAQRHASQTADIYAEFRSETTGKTLKEMADEV